MSLEKNSILINNLNNNRIKILIHWKKQDKKIIFKNYIKELKNYNNNKKKHKNYQQIENHNQF